MGKPIAARNKFPFGVNGIVVDAAVLKDGTKLNDIRISKQRSINVFDLLSADGATVYPFISLSGVDKSGAYLDKDASGSELTDALPNGTFCIGMEDAGTNVGFAIRLMLNKVTLADGSSLFITNYAGQSTVAVESVAVTPKTADIFVGSGVTLSASVTPSNATDKSVTWLSGTPSVATVSSTGLVLGVANGTSVITATTTDGSFTDTSTVTVTTAVASVTLAPKTATLSLAGTTTQQLTPTVLPATASVKTVTYTSSDDTKATVSASGLVTAVAIGSATITVHTDSGSKTDTAVITITA